MALQLRRMVFSELSFWIAFAIIGLYFILPIRQKIRFGMDLVGGTYLTLEVQVDEAVTNDLVDKMQRMESYLKKNNLPTPTTKSVENKVINLVFASNQDAQVAAAEISKKFTEPALSIASEGAALKISVPESYQNRVKTDAVERNVEVLRNRLNAAIEEIPIAAQGEQNIVIELPDTANAQEAKNRIGTSAQLEFRLVHGQEARSEADILDRYEGVLPADKEILRTRDGKFYLVDKYAEVTGRMLRHAYRAEDPRTLESVVAFEFNDEGAEKFAELTGKNYMRLLAIVLDGIILSAPQIQEKIEGGTGRISGHFTDQSAKELASLLKSGSYVARVTFGEERQIGPSLGTESRQQGLISCLVGLVGLFIFSIYFYSLCGLFAFLALIYNLFLVLIGLSWLHATLTLPGVAGMVLTIGMAIDASILIYERIKEELAKGQPIEKSVKHGFSDAMTVILDANITTFIVGVVLYYFGTGPIQGFAVTMILGIIATLITELFFLRSLFNFVLQNFSIKRLKI